jgi:hypothetical protein
MASLVWLRSSSTPSATTTIRQPPGSMSTTRLSIRGVCNSRLSHRVASRFSGPATFPPRLDRTGSVTSSSSGPVLAMTVSNSSYRRITAGRRPCRKIRRMPSTPLVTLGNLKPRYQRSVDSSLITSSAEVMIPKVPSEPTSSGSIDQADMPGQ